MGSVRRRKIVRYYTHILLAVLLVFAAIPFVAAEAPAKEVRMTNKLTFEPKTITIKSGETVIWKNVSGMVHSATDVPSMATKPQDAALPRNAKEFNSGMISPGKDYSHTFTVPGTYKYFCIPHEELGMVGTIIVQK